MTRKISDGVARIKLGLADELRLGNLDAERDWGYAGDYVEAMWMMLQREEPGLSRGDGRDALGARVRGDRVRPCRPRLGTVRQDRSGVLRPAEVDQLVGNPAKAKRDLGWEPRHSFRELVEMMVDADIGRLTAMSSISSPAS